MKASQSIRLFSPVDKLAMLLELLDIIHPDSLTTWKQATHRRQESGFIWEVTQLVISSFSGFQGEQLCKQLHRCMLDSQRVNPELFAASLCLSVCSLSYPLVARWITGSSTWILLSTTAVLLSSTLILVSSTSVWLSSTLVSLTVTSISLTFS